MERLFELFTNWAKQTFCEATAQTSLKKLRKESLEVETELNKPEIDKEKLAVEYADCIMCVFDSAARAGLSYDDLYMAFWDKLAINVRRKWVKNPDGTYSHVK